MAWAPPGVSEKDLRPTSASSLAQRGGGGPGWACETRPLPQSHTDQGGSRESRILPENWS